MEPLQGYKIQVDEDGHLMTTHLQNEKIRTKFPGRDIGQVIAFYAKLGYKHVRENDIDYLVRDASWEPINEVVPENVHYQKGGEDEDRTET
ncbi:MAG: hypothetical protein CL607_14975 [Anaerolineaceae bacterium]|nr:hypothetical protein [Anaerolineaceae bacterium]